MKRYLIILTCGLWLSGAVAPAMAVEKKEKSAATQNVAPKKTPPPAKKPAPKTTGKVAPKKYDDFVDKNKNGIDDRKETVKIKDDQQTKPNSTEKKAAEKKPGS